MIGIAILALIILWLSACLYFYRNQDRIIYARDNQVPNMSRASVYPGQTIALRPNDNPNLETKSWYWPAKENRPTILFFHGNNGNVESRTSWMQFALKKGWGLFMTGYRGYGGNPGIPNQAGLINDGLRAFDFLAQDCNVPTDQIHILGHSLGSGVGTQVATQRPCRSLGLMSPFTSLVNTAFDLYPFLPTAIILRDHWRSIEKITDIRCPLAVAYCDQDTTVKGLHSLRLFQRANEPKEIVNLPGIDHGDIALSGGPKYLVDFFDRIAQQG